MMPSRQPAESSSVWLICRNGAQGVLQQFLTPAIRFLFCAFELAKATGSREFPVMKFQNVTATAKANLYFEGKVISHGIVTADGEKKSFGVIFPGEYHFGTEAAERMDMTAGECVVQLDGSDDTAMYSAGQFFEVAADSGFTITVGGEVCEYVCSYLK